MSVNIKNYRLVQLTGGFVGTKQTEKAQKQVCAFVFNGDPGGIRTPDPRLRRPLLYPTELLNHYGAGDGNRTHNISLEG